MTLVAMTRWAIIVFEVVKIGIEELIDPLAVVSIWNARPIKGACGLDILEVDNCPTNRARVESAGAGDSVKGLLWRRNGIRSREKDMPPPSLRDADLQQIDRVDMYTVFCGDERVTCYIDDVAMIVSNLRDVLDDEYLRLENFGGAGHPCIETVSRIFAARAVVEARMALAWRAADENRYGADTVAKLSLSLSERCSQLTVD